MLLPDNLHPEQSIYFNGALVLDMLQKLRTIDLLDLYDRVRRAHEMSMPVFVLCLDWLFLLDLVKIDEKGSVHLCT